MEEEQKTNEDSVEQKKDNEVKNDENKNNNVDKKESDNKWSFKNDVIDFFKDLAIVIVIVVLIRTFLILPFQISGQSMYDSYYDREFIIVDVLTYLDIPLIWELSWPKRGDVIVFRPHVNEKKEYYIKRIIGLEWDILKIAWWEVFLKKKWSDDFVLLDEKYLDSSNYWKTFVWLDNWESIYEVPENSFFVMWDNRNWSSDSRSCFTWHCNKEWHSNYITKSDIVWKVMLDLWYFNFKLFSFTHPYLGIDTTPKFFSSPDSFDYE